MQQLPPALQLHVLSFLPPNDRALSGRLVSPDAAAGLSEPQHCTAFLSQPLPPHAVPWAVEAGQQHVRQLPFRHKLQLLCTAAASGSEVNLEVALALLQPSVFPGMLEGQWRKWSQRYAQHDPGEAAIKADRPQLVGWLLRHCPGLLHPNRMLEVAAWHCDLTGLQAVWEGVQSHPSNSGPEVYRPVLHQGVLDAAANSPSPDGVAKLAWLVEAGGWRCTPTRNTAAAAASSSGYLSRLRWLQERGCPMRGEGFVQCVLENAHLPALQWLVEEAGCELLVQGGNGSSEEEEEEHEESIASILYGQMAFPEAIPCHSREDEAGNEWEPLLMAAAKGPDGVAVLSWLQEQGAPPFGGDKRLTRRVLGAAVEAGRLETVRHVLSVLGQGSTPAMDDGGRAAVLSGSVPVAECLHQAGLVFDGSCYSGAAYGGVALVRWLASEARVPAAELRGYELGSLARRWPRKSPKDSRDLLQAVQLLVEQAGFCDWEGFFESAHWREVVRRGDLALLQYLLLQRPGYGLGGGALEDATEAGCEPLLEWLVEQHPGCLFGPWKKSSPHCKAAGHGDRATLNTLQQLGVPWGADSVVQEAVVDGAAGPVLRWLVEQGAPVSSREAAMEAVLVVYGGELGGEERAWLRGLTAAQAAAAAEAAAAAVGELGDDWDDDEWEEEEVDETEEEGEDEGDV